MTEIMLTMEATMAATSVEKLTKLSKRDLQELCEAAEDGIRAGGAATRQGFQRRKLAISLSPVAWLFSGWNCVPARLSRPTTAVIGPP